MSQPVTMPKVDRWWLFEHNSDFCGGDTHGDACHSMEQCLELMAKKPHTLPDGRHMAYQYYAPAGKLYNKPIGHNGGSQWRSGSMNLIMWGCSVGHVSNGKTLIRLNGVDVCGVMERSSTGQHRTRTPSILWSSGMRPTPRLSGMHLHVDLFSNPRIRGHVGREEMAFFLCGQISPCWGANFQIPCRVLERVVRQRAT